MAQGLRDPDSYPGAGITADKPIFLGPEVERAPGSQIGVFAPRVTPQPYQKLMDILPSKAENRQAKVVTVVTKILELFSVESDGLRGQGPGRFLLDELMEEGGGGRG